MSTPNLGNSTSGKGIGISSHLLVLLTSKAMSHMLVSFADEDGLGMLCEGTSYCFLIAHEFPHSHENKKACDIYSKQHNAEKSFSAIHIFFSFDTGFQEKVLQSQHKIDLEC